MTKKTTWSISKRTLLTPTHERYYGIQGEKVRIVADKSYFYTCEHPPHIKPKVPLSFDLHLEELHWYLLV